MSRTYLMDDLSIKQAQKIVDTWSARTARLVVDLLRVDRAPSLYRDIEHRICFLLSIHDFGAIRHADVSLAMESTAYDINRTIRETPALFRRDYGWRPDLMSVLREFFVGVMDEIKVGALRASAD